MRQLEVRERPSEFVVALPKDDLRLAGVVDTTTDELVDTDQTAVVSLEQRNPPTFQVVLPSADDDLEEIADVVAPSTTGD